MKRILAYTREPLDGQIYSHKLAKSLHLALDLGDGFKPLNYNYGILFARATSNEDLTLNAKNLDLPYIFRKADGSFGIVAISLSADMEKFYPDEERCGSVIVFSSKDLVHYTENGTLKLSDSMIEDVVCEFENGTYNITWLDADGWKTAQSDDLESIKNVSVSSKPVYATEKPEIEGICPRNIIEISDTEADYLNKKLTPMTNIAIDLPEDITVSSREELNSVFAAAVYSDGSTAKKRIDWYDGNVDYSTPGTYTVKGRVHQDHFVFPIAWNRADPCIGKWNGKYYFIATNDADGNNSLYIREADSVAGLVTAQEVKILNTKMYPHMKCLLWAPEFHIIKNELYIFHAASPNGFGQERSHIMKLRHGGNPMLAEDWEVSRPVVKNNGEPIIGDLGITLDMTHFEIDGHHYVIWSHRTFTPKDLGAWLCISEIDPDEPWHMIKEPVVISKPDYGWSNNMTFVDEGPYPLLTKDKIIITFSAAMVDATYVVAMLTADYGTDLLDPASWTKSNYPILTSATVKGEYGTGHNAYVTDGDGNIWNSYHGRPGVHMPRSSGIRRVHFDIDGEPVLGLTEEKDLAPELTCIEAKVTVKG